MVQIGSLLNLRLSRRTVMQMTCQLQVHKTEGPNPLPQSDYAAYPAHFRALGTAARRFSAVRRRLIDGSSKAGVQGEDGEGHLAQALYP